MSRCPASILLEVQHVADQREQLAGGAQRDLGQVALLGGERGRREHVERAGDRDERRPQLVADRGQEARLRAVGALGLLAGAAQLGLERLALGDVGDVAVELAEPSVGASARASIQAIPPPSACTRYS